MNEPPVYMVSYPRSGKSWLTYCCGIVLGNNSLIDNCHYLGPHEGHPHLNLDNDYDNISILLMRNYKDAILSNFTSLCLKQVDDIFNELFIAWMHRGVSHPHIEPYTPSAACRNWLDAWAARTIPTANVLEELMTDINTPRATHSVDDFLLDGYPRMDDSVDHERFKLADRRWNHEDLLVDFSEGYVGAMCSSTFIYHYYLALQLQRYYNLINYYDKKRKLHPKKILLVKYEDFMKDPYTELSHIIDFLKKNSVIDYPSARECYDRLKDLLNNFEFHKEVSIKAYRAQGHIAISYKRDSQETKEDIHVNFLKKMTGTLKRRDPKLFDEYLKNYGEK